MSTIINCKIDGFEVKISNNSVKAAVSSLQIELVKRLIECKASVEVGESALPLFFNKYLRFYPISDVEFIQERSLSNAIPMTENWEVKRKIAA